MTNREKILERIVKLLTLSLDEGASPAERANAKQKADAMREKYRVELGELEGQKDRMRADKTAPCRDEWKQRCLGAVARLCDVYSFRDGTSLRFVGKSHDLAVFDHFADFVLARADRALEAWTADRPSRPTLRDRLAFLDSFAAGVWTKVLELVPETPPGKALTRYDEAEATARAMFRLRDTQGTAREANEDGFAAGHSTPFRDALTGEAALRGLLLAS